MRDGPGSGVYDVASVLDTLGRTPDVLRALLDGLPEEVVHADEGGEPWSPFDVVGHLVHGEKTDWIPRLRIILSEGESRPFDSFDRFAQLEASESRSMADLLDEFTALRAANLEALTAILAALLVNPIDLDATGTHPELGRVTAGQLLSTWATHDLGHIGQVARVLAKRFGEATGPWRAYLPVLGERS